MSQYPSVAIPPRLPLVVTTANRNSSVAKDARLVNCYVETDSSTQEVHIYKRPGILEDSRPPADNIAGYGIYNWQGDVYSVFGSSLYRNGVVVAASINNNQQVYKFSSILGATPRLILGNGAAAYAYDVVGGLSTNLHGINVEFPSVFVKGWAYLNGATYVMDNKAVIWGSAINSVSQPGDWNPLNFISAQIEPDDAVGLDKQLVYVVAFNQWSTEIFFDAGNATGSPLGSVPGSKISYGCRTVDSIQSIDTKLLWVTNTREASPQVAVMEGLSVTIVSTKPIERILEVADFDTVYSFVLRVNGHAFYVLTLKESNITLAYDIQEDLWHQWTDANGNYFPFVAATFDSQNRHILQHESNGRLYRISSEYFNDNGDIIDSNIYTPNFDASTRRRKQLNLMNFIADQTDGSLLEVSVSDDDYKTWSNPRRVYLSQKQPALTNCGTFKRRAFRLRHRSNTFMRLQAVEVQYDIGAL